MRIKYVGPDAGGVVVPVLGDQEFKRDEAQDVPDDIGNSLCQQVGNWEEVVETTNAPKGDK